jgi:hypothetical protein
MKLLTYLSGFILLSTAWGCSNDIEINAPYQDIAVVYSFLDQNEPIQYIRIQKVYQNNAGLSTSEGAQISDSLYFDSLEVSITNVNTKVVYPCTKIDTIPKEAASDTTGIFGNSKHFLYACKIPKNPNNEVDDIYQLFIRVPKSGKTFRATTKIVKDASIEARTIPLRTAPANTAFPFRFITGKNSFLYDLVVRFKYKEMNVNDTSIFNNKYIDYYVQRSKKYTYSLSINTESVVSINFINHIKSNLVYDVSKTRRTLGIEFIAYGGSEELRDYIDLNKPNTSIVPKNTEYSNIENGKGIFTSRNYTVQNGVVLDEISYEVLRKELPNFK